MRVVVTVVGAAGARADVAVRAEISTPLADLLPGFATALGVPAPRTVTVDGEVVDPDEPAARWLRDGCVVVLDGPTSPPDPPAALWLHADSGPDAGGRVPVLPGRGVVVGRAPDCDLVADDPLVSRHHLRVSVDGDGVTVADLGSRNGTALDRVPLAAEGARLPLGGRVRLGDSTVLLCGPPDAPLGTAAGPDGGRRVHRPPRVRPADPATRVELPALPVAGRTVRFPAVTLLAPLAVGLLAWVLIRERGLLLLMLLSPVLAGGQALGDRWAARRQARTARTRYDAALTRARDRLTVALGAEERARREAAPDPATVATVAAGPGPRLWERRPGDDDFLDLRLGLADLPAAVQVVDPSGGPPPVVTDVPVTVPLTGLGVLGLAGPGAPGLARWLLAQAAVLHAPRDLTVAVLTSATRVPAWEWARWLPHCRAEGGARIGCTPAQLSARTAELTRRLGAGPDGGTAGAGGAVTLVVVDDPGLVRDVPGLAAVLAGGPAAGILAVCLADDPAALPEQCRAVVATADTARARLHRTGQPPLILRADGVGAGWCDRVARALAPLRDDPADGDLPADVRWLDLAGLVLDGGAGDADAVVERWAAGGDTRVPLGRGADGPVEVDLCRDGPHALVAGTTGSGKSELLRTLVGALAAANPPDRLAFVLVDYKGGAAFGPCVDLPHTTGLVTDLDPALTERALVSLGAELRRREALLAAAGVGDIGEYQARDAGPPLARLVLVVDEFATLAEELPAFVSGLVAIAQRGRSLGVHLVLATQRPHGAVSADIRANTNLRICLAVTDDADSRDVLDAPLAARIGTDTPGRGYLRSGAARPLAFQAARLGPAPADPVTGVSVQVLAGLAADAADATGQPAAPAAGRRDDLDRLVRAVGLAARAAAVSAPDPPWLPPLPTTVTVAELPVPGEDGCRPAGRLGPVALGLVDRPARQAQAPLLVDLDRSTHLLVAGGPRSGRTTALRTLAGVLAGRVGPADLHLYAVDGAAGLRGLADLTHCGAVVGVDEPDRVGRLLDLLDAEVARRRGLLAAAGAADLAEHRAGGGRTAHLVLMVDGWEQLAVAPGGESAAERVLRLLGDGAAVGVHVVVACGRGGLVGRLAAGIGDRLVLALADPADYGLVGLPLRQVPSRMPAGRGFALPDLDQVQLALLAADPSGAGQAEALAAVADRARESAADVPTELLPVRVDPLPERVEAGELDRRRRTPRPDGPAVVTLGLGGDVLGPVDLDLCAAGHLFAVAGPPGSGRTTALVAIGRSVRLPVVAIAAPSSPLHRLAGAAVLAPDATPSAFAAAAGEGPAAVLVDDWELIGDGPLAGPLEQFARRARVAGSVLVLAGQPDELAVAFRGAAAEVRRARCGLLLCPRPGDGDALGVRSERPALLDPPPGRGLLVVRGRVTALQVADPA